MLWSKLTGTKPSEAASECELLASLAPEKLPKHIAIIMDGNGRWAKKRGLPRSLGHRAGVETLRTTVTSCSNLGIKVLTVYAFSTENWKRPAEEVDILMNLLVEYLQKEIRELHKNNVLVRAIGNLAELPKTAQTELENAKKLTGNNTGLILNLALNYGGRVEILTATRKIATLVNQGMLRIEDIDEEVFRRFLYTAGLPDPDLLIRTSGEMRVSNYLLWQLAYSEMYVTDTLWPDFNKIELFKALVAYQQRDRRFGGLNSNNGGD
ncbi:MAG TPA: isoprenyl transferase [Desulfobacteria bacterium]|nr:isoprenyl transferase [Desulfobacteria bacterium]